MSGRVADNDTGSTSISPQVEQRHIAAQAGAEAASASVIYLAFQPCALLVGE